MGVIKGGSQANAALKVTEHASDNISSMTPEARKKYQQAFTAQVLQKALGLESFYQLVWIYLMLQEDSGRNSDIMPEELDPQIWQQSVQAFKADNNKLIESIGLLRTQLEDLGILDQNIDRSILQRMGSHYVNARKEEAKGLVQGAWNAKTFGPKGMLIGAAIGGSTQGLRAASKSAAYEKAILDANGYCKQNNLELNQS